MKNKINNKPTKRKKNQKQQMNQHPCLSSLVPWQKTDCVVRNLTQSLSLCAAFKLHAYTHKSKFRVVDGKPTLHDTHTFLF